MKRGTAGQYWADTAEGQFQSMSSTYQPGERADAEPAPTRVRQPLPPLTASQTIVDAIAACAQPRQASGQPAPAIAHQAAPAAAAE